jgi:hypothetical protein
MERRAASCRRPNEQNECSYLPNTCRRGFFNCVIPSVANSLILIAGMALKRVRSFVIAGCDKTANGSSFFAQRRGDAARICDHNRCVRHLPALFLQKLVQLETLLPFGREFGGDFPITGVAYFDNYH